MSGISEDQSKVRYDDEEYFAALLNDLQKALTEGRRVNHEAQILIDRAKAKKAKADIRRSSS